MLSDPKKRMTPNLDHYVELEEGEDGMKLMHYYHPELRKVYFHIFKQSDLKENYGERLGRELLKVL